jgi:hypothetical protein
MTRPAHFHRSLSREAYIHDPQAMIRDPMCMLRHVTR